MLKMAHQRIGGVKIQMMDFFPFLSSLSFVDGNILRLLYILCIEFNKDLTNCKWL